ncbi:ATP-dependent helicase [Aureisphaera sp. CAU 1614]|uniref:DNA 3'-5' helicase n=1 Tax=Halomarinibacterium sedimenti TaxID=2857106 RepID=A0A9X1JVB4_9FLAO|nr:ATP-dependent helicase [Halomarinibacterium sedimenti]MBW2937535.1 ATP-dependent helicase [Halomarinibacterium sedimenti]
MPKKDLEYYWELKKFNPNEKQKKAILHFEGPLFLTAGPGSGKTRVLLWRTVNLIVFHNIDPKRIFLATFTEKAAHQLKEGLRSLLGLITNETGVPYDISGMAIGTVHSICQDILVDRDRCFSDVRSKSPILLDSLSQYFKIYRRTYWRELLHAGGYLISDDIEKDEEIAQREINNYFDGNDYYSRHYATSNLISIFNRFSEENLNPNEVETSDEVLQKILKMYEFYCNSHKNGKIETVDFSLLQQRAFNKIKEYNNSCDVYDHIIVDEYQDTNAIQEQIYFELAKKCKNICVVGDDDQALYRFRGATVENLVEFEDRCKKYLGLKPTRIDLDTNYRSKKNIVQFYTDFIEQSDWSKPRGNGYYRVHDKNILPFNQEDFPAIVTTDKNTQSDVFAQVAQFILDLREQDKIEDFNQVAFLFPSLSFRGVKNTAVQRLENALNNFGIQVFAPRAGRFLDIQESLDVFGLMLHILGRPSHQGQASGGLQDFRMWQIRAMTRAEQLMSQDSFLKEYVEDRQTEIKGMLSDYEALMKIINKKKWRLEKPLQLDMMRDLANASGLSNKCKLTLQKRAFLDLLKRRQQAKQPVSLSYVINRVTSADWSILDIFYQLNGFKHFQEMYQLAEEGIDEGPVCNLGLITQYLARFMEEYTAIITASFLYDRKFTNTFVGSYLYAIYRLGESEYEDADDPFPKGRVPFLTIHQSKGLEFPYVVIGNLNKIDRPADMKEIIVRDLLQKEGEPLDKISHFDNMRMFYVALSRAKQMTILPQWKGQRQSQAFKNMFKANDFPKLDDLNWNIIPQIALDEEDLGKTYSYTSDYLNYQQCPRKYMIFKKYGFIPSRSQTMFFGSLVHQTIEDLHHLLISNRKKENA